jgi:hypothetical protein
MSRFALAFALLFPLAAFSQVDAPKPAPPPSPPAKIADVAWLTGYWVGEGMGGAAEDVWSPARNGVMIGLFRLMKPDGSPNFYQLFSIEEHEGSLRFVFKHFGPDWVGWEDKDKAQRLRLTALSKSEAAFGGVVFQNPDPETLVVKVTMRTRDGASSTNAFTFKKKAL